MATHAGVGLRLKPQHMDLGLGLSVQGLGLKDCLEWGYSSLTQNNTTAGTSRWARSEELHRLLGTEAAETVCKSCALLGPQP